MTCIDDKNWDRLKCLVNIQLSIMVICDRVACSRGYNFLVVRQRYIAKETPVLASGIEKLAIIIRDVIKFPLSAGTLLVFVRFSIIFY